MKDSSGSYVYCDDKKAELLSDYFTSVFTSDNKSIPNINRRCSSEISDIVFTPNAIEQKETQEVEGYIQYWPGWVASVITEESRS